MDMVYLLQRTLFLTIGSTIGSTNSSRYPVLFCTIQHVRTTEHSLCNNTFSKYDLLGSLQ